MNKDIRMILASGSPRRRELLTQAGYEYEVITSDVSEDTDVMQPKDMVMQLASRKAFDVFEKEKGTGKLIVIGADTVVSLNNRILGKPYDFDDAYNTLNSLSGQTHHVYTGVAIIYFDGKEVHSNIFYERTEVEFYLMTHEEIVWYLSTGEPFDKAGSYGIQGKGGIFVKGIKGDYNNVVGLPLSRIYHELEQMEV